MEQKCTWYSFYYRLIQFGCGKYLRTGKGMRHPFLASTQPSTVASISLSHQLFGVHKDKENSWKFEQNDIRQSFIPVGTVIDIDFTCLWQNETIPAMKSTSQLGLRYPVQIQRDSVEYENRDDFWDLVRSQTRGSQFRTRDLILTEPCFFFPILNDSIYFHLSFHFVSQYVSSLEDDKFNRTWIQQDGVQPHFEKSFLGLEGTGRSRDQPERLILPREICSCEID